MKTVKIVCLALSALLALSGCSVKNAREQDATPPSAAATPETQSAEISLDEAKQLALDAAGVSAADATFRKAALEYEDGGQVYEIEFYTDDADYAYEIGVSDGLIYSQSVEQFAPSGGQAGGADIDLEQAKAIAFDHAGVSAADVTLKEAKQDVDDGAEVFEIEFYLGGKEYEYKIRAADGTILEYDID